MLTILGGAAIIAALLGALTSRRLARWAIEPLVRLGERLGDAPMDQATDLGGDEGVREIDALRKTLRALLDRRAEALRSARLFAAGAAHELRTPLTTLSGELQLLGEESLAPSIQERIGALQSSTAHIVELVERLLVFARVGAAEAIRHDAVELGDVLEQVCRRASRNAKGRLTYEPRVMPIVRGDESLLSVLCENAINNAILHASPAAVRVVLDEQNGDVFVDVIDDGPGIDYRDRGRLFEPFQRGTVPVPGAGLGLALIRQIARAHGGEAVFVDAAGGGAHLRVRLPPWAPKPTKA
ncbi:MAG TPA: HAMP domain-containing sensor histidine kinase, partial [Polyangium sp.]|nr:HAMP domain-containing sensor histidine kinase [Polyangium sp.]